MAPDQRVVHRQEVSLITELIALGQRSAALDARDARLRAACECAALSLSKDLQAIIECEDLLRKSIDEHPGK